MRGNRHLHPTPMNGLIDIKVFNAEVGLVLEIDVLRWPTWI
jgi:hypothetical protein